MGVSVSSIGSAIFSYIIGEHEIPIAYYIPTRTTYDYSEYWSSEIALMSKMAIPFLRNPNKSNAYWKSQTYSRHGYVLIKHGIITRKGAEMGVLPMHKRDLELGFYEFESLVQSKGHATYRYVE